MSWGRLVGNRRMGEQGIVGDGYVIMSASKIKKNLKRRIMPFY